MMNHLTAGQDLLFVERGGYLGYHILRSVGLKPFGGGKRSRVSLVDSRPSVHSSDTVLLGLSGSEVEIISQGTISARLDLWWSPKISDPGVGMLYEKYHEPFLRFLNFEA